jgi:adenosine deaminase
MLGMVWKSGCSAAGLTSKGFVSEEGTEYGHRVWIVPKVELHVHLEAAVNPGFYEALNSRRKLFDIQSLPAKRAPFPQFKDFIKAWVDNTRLIENENDVEEMVVSFAGERSKLNIVYSDVHISPSDFSYLRARFGDGQSHVFPFESLVKAYLRGAQKAALLHPNIWFRYILDVVWLANEADMSMLQKAIPKIVESKENQDPRGGLFLVGLGLGGPETPDNLKTLVPGMEILREHKLKLELHTGENQPWIVQEKSMNMLKPDRVAHGLAGAHLGEFHNGHTVFCPISNLRSGAAFLFEGKGSRCLDVLPFDNYAGANVSIGSDDPLLFQTNLIFEYVMLHEQFGVKDEFLRSTQLKAQLSAFDQWAVQKALKII